MNIPYGLAQGELYWERWTSIWLWYCCGMNSGDMLYTAKHLRGNRFCGFHEFLALPRKFSCVCFVVSMHTWLMTVCKHHFKSSLKLTPTEHQPCEWKIDLSEKLLIPFSFTFLTGTYGFQGEEVSLARSGRAFKRRCYHRRGKRRGFINTEWQSIE